jgi:hypothetical protein
MSCRIGDQVSVRQTACTVRFVGGTHFAEGTWVGVEFPTSCGRNDGSVEGVRYFECAPRQGLFVRPAQIQPRSAAVPRVERDVPEEHAHAWATMEKMLEAEAIEAGVAGDRTLRHLESLHPKRAGALAGGCNDSVRSTDSRGAARQVCLPCTHALACVRT